MLMTPRFKSRFLIAGAAACALSLAAFATPAAAQEASQTNAAKPEAPKITRRDSFKDWTLQCVAPKGTDVCELVQAFVNKDTKNVLMRIQVVHGAQGKNIMVITLPLGVDIRKGGALKIAENKVLNKLPYVFCLRDGCRVQFALNDDVLAAMKGATDPGAMVFGRPGQQKNIGIPVSFAGFSDAYDAFLKTPVPPEPAPAEKKQ